MTQTPERLSEEELKEIERALNAIDKAAPPPWSRIYSKIFAPSEKGGDRTLFDVRGWGYYTGKGGGALGLTDEEALERMGHDGDGIVAFRNAAPLVRKLLDHIRASSNEKSGGSNNATVAQLVESGTCSPRDSSSTLDGGSNRAGWSYNANASGKYICPCCGGRADAERSEFASSSTPQPTPPHPLLLEKLKRRPQYSPPRAGGAC